MSKQQVLLLNASNMETCPVYPYAFIQVPAIARRSGIEVICQDMLGIPNEQWKQTLETLIRQHNPVMILITLRNIDSHDPPDYEKDRLKETGRSAYFPVERTRELITTIREISGLKIILGGFGFSLLPDALMHYLRPDFGVYEGPDSLFAHFEDLRYGKVGHIANLLYFHEGKLISNRRNLYPPLADAEYTPKAIEEMMAFYKKFPSPGFQGAALEIMRGCNHSCVFCSEPYGKGKQVRYRDLSVVMKDIEILTDHGVTQLYIVSSELNPEGNEFILELADRIWLFNKSRADGEKVTWYGANYLLNFESDEYERLYRSAFTGGWFDFTALDDENARAMRTPYRNARLVRHLEIYASHQKRQIELLKAQKALGREPKPRAGDSWEDKYTLWSMFLGNPATTIETIRNTLQVANQEGLSDLFDDCGLHTYIRVFDYEDPDEATVAVTYSVTPDLNRSEYQQLLPSFAYPPALLQDFSEEEIQAMFSYLAATYLSKKYLRTRDWHGFIKQWATPASISTWTTKLGQAPESMPLGSELFKKKALDSRGDEDMNQRARNIVDSLMSACLDAFPGFFASLGLPSSMEAIDRITPYELAVVVFRKWDHAEELTNQTTSVSPKWKRDLLQFCVQAMLYRFNIIITPKYKPLFQQAQSEASP